MESAVSDVIDGNLSIRRSACKYNVKVATLQHRVEKRKRTSENPDTTEARYKSKYTSQQVFSNAQEKLLNDYIIKCSKMHHGLTIVQVRELAYEYAKRNDCRYPPAWDENKCVGIDWISGFRKRNPNISLRKPENTSIARSFSFNKTSVSIFFDNLEEVLVRYQFSSDRILNFDETGVTTVLNTPKVFAEKTQRQVGQMVSAERGELVTFGGIITGTGNTIPPVYVFPRVNYKSHFITGAPEGSLGLSSRSGWINSELFVEVLKHIQKHTNSTKDRPILLICDNHESHISIEAINYSRENGIVYLSFPPHTSHKLQPLDVGVFGPFKSKLKVYFNDWHINHPGKALSIYDIPSLTKLAYFKSFSGKNISSAFMKPGIVPFNRLAFSDDDYAPCEIYTNRGQSNDDIEIYQSVSQVTPPRPLLEQNPSNLEPVASTSRDSDTLTAQSPRSLSVQRQNDMESVASPSMTSDNRSQENTSNTTLQPVTPEAIRPYPTVSNTKKTRKGKEKGKCRIYTDTPEKTRLEQLRDMKNEKIAKQEQRKRVKEMKTAQNLLGIKATKQKQKNKVLIESDSSNCDSDVELQESSDSLEENSISEQSDNGQTVAKKPKVDELNEGDFVIVNLKVSGKKNVSKQFVGKILFRYNNQKGNDFQVSFLKRKPSFVSGTASFIIPDKKDEASVHVSDIVLKLPSPVMKKGTSRTAAMYNFQIDLSTYNIPI